MCVGEYTNYPEELMLFNCLFKFYASFCVRNLVFIPKRVAERLKEYTLSVCKNSYDRIFPISYEAARVIVAKAGRLVNIKLRPHDLRRHAATYASRSGVPIEIVSKVILRHANLSTTQLYLGKISETEAMSWIDNLYR
jgi:integrase